MSSFHLLLQIPLWTCLCSVFRRNVTVLTVVDNFRMNTGYGRYSAIYNMVGLSCFNDELPCV